MENLTKNEITFPNEEVWIDKRTAGNKKDSEARQRRDRLREVISSTQAHQLAKRLALFLARNPSPEVEADLQKYCREKNLDIDTEHIRKEALKIETVYARIAGGSQETKQILSETLLESVISGQLNADIYDRFLKRIEIKETIDPNHPQRVEGVNYAANSSTIQSPNGKRFGRVEFYRNFFENISREDRLRIPAHELMHIMMSTTFDKRLFEPIFKGQSEIKREIDPNLEGYYISSLLDSNHLEESELLEELICERFADFSRVGKESLPKKLSREELEAQNPDRPFSEAEWQGALLENSWKRARIGGVRMMANRLTAILAETGGEERLKRFFGESYSLITATGSIDKTDLSLVDFDLLVSRLGEKEQKYFQREIERNQKLFLLFEKQLSNIQKSEEVLDEHKENEDRELVDIVDIDIGGLGLEETPYFAATPYSREVSNASIDALATGLAQSIANTFKGGGTNQKQNA